MLSQAQTCAEVDFLFLPGARVAGTVWNTYGEPAADAIVVIHRTKGPESQQVLGYGLHSARSDKHGRFEIERVLPGAYAVAMASVNRPSAQAPYVRVEPRVTPSHSPQAILEVSQDQNLEGVHLRLPDLELHTLNVAVFRPDGSPADGVGIEVKDAFGWAIHRLGDSHNDGKFVLNLFVGQTYQIRAYNFLSDSEGQRAEAVTLIVKRENRSVFITLGWPPGPRPAGHRE